MKELQIGIIGDFNPGMKSHMATNDALRHAADFLSVPVISTWVATDFIEGRSEKELKRFDGLWCAPGSPYKSMDGALQAIRCAREKKIPFFAT